MDGVQDKCPVLTPAAEGIDAERGAKGQGDGETIFLPDMQVIAVVVVVVLSIWLCFVVTVVWCWCEVLCV